MKIVCNPGRSVEITAPLCVSWRDPGYGDGHDHVSLEDRDLAELLRNTLSEGPQEADRSEDLWRRRVRITVEVLG